MLLKKPRIIHPRLIYFLLMPRVGVEPTWTFVHWFLKPARKPIPAPRRAFYSNNFLFIFQLKITLSVRALYLLSFSFY